MYKYAAMTAAHADCTLPSPWVTSLTLHARGHFLLLDALPAYRTMQAASSQRVVLAMQSLLPQPDTL